MRALVLGAVFGALVALRAQERLPLRVLYAGDPDIARTEHWLGFLRERTTRVRFVDRQHILPDSLRDIDVVVIDGDVVRHVEALQPGPPRYPDLELLLGVPTVLVGNIGAAVGGAMHLKTSGFFG